jgi:RHS repeat-associated protein
VGGTTTKFLVDSVNPTGYAQVIDELVSGAVTRTYAYGLQRISENQKIGATQTASFYGYDGHGNVRFLTGSAGTATDTYVYDAFGLPITTTGTTPNNFLYSDEQYDGALGLYYLRARYYNPATGRFLAMDPWKHKSCCGLCSPSRSNNMYAYADDDPVNKSDPIGKVVIAGTAITYEHIILATATGLTALHLALQHRGMRCKLFDEGFVTDPWTRESGKFCLYLCDDLTVTTRQGWWGVPCEDSVPED